MAVENPVYINEFNEAWPDGLDSKSQGDDHIRNIKGALKRTFPRITGPTQVTQADLNKLTVPGSTIVPGMIMIWPYELAAIPAGWKVCNGAGAISTGRPVPNLIDRFLVGAGNQFGVGAIGGNGVIQPAVTVQGHALTEAQMPAHNHPINYMNTPTTEYRPGIGAAELQSGYGNGILTNVNYDRVQYKGGNQPHAHGAYIAPFDVRSPFYAIWYIIKD